MLLQQPAESPYDLRFPFFGFQTRISWTFWIAALVIGYDSASFVDAIFGPESPGRIAMVAIWMGCMALSILIHELGHTLAFRWYGIDSSIVLYYLGGLAIPQGGMFGRRRNYRDEDWQNLIIAAAGPALQIASALLLVGLSMAQGYSVAFLPWPFSLYSPAMELQQFESPLTFALVNFYVWPSLAWGLLNLLPVLPMDGGRIAESIANMLRLPSDVAPWIGVMTAGFMAYYGFTTRNTFLGIFFASLAINNYQMIQMRRW